MFLFSDVDLIFILSFAFIFILILIWIVTAIIIKKVKKNKKVNKTNNINNPINTEASKNVEENNDKVINEESLEEKKEAIIQPVSNEEPKADEDSKSNIVEEESKNETESNNTSAFKLASLLGASPVEEKKTEEIEESNDLSNEENVDSNEKIQELDAILNDSAENKTEESKLEPEIIEETKVEEEKIEENDTNESNDIIEEPIVEKEIENVEDNKEEAPIEHEVSEETEEPIQSNIIEEPKADIEPKEEVEKVKINAKPVKKGRTYNGKFEIYEAGDGYAYQLKASNGEILVVSEIYSSRDSVIKAIKAVQKNIDTGEVRIFADKKGKYKFKLVAKNYKTLAISASYTVEKSAIRASESFKKYAMIADIVDVEIEDKEAAMATVIEKEAVEKKNDGKYIIEKFDGEYSWALKASNGQILCQAEGYTSKTGCLYSIDTFKKNVLEGEFRCIKDKNGNYCYKLYTPNNRICAVGESYNSKSSVQSAVSSVLAYYDDAKIEEIK